MGRENVSKTDMVRNMFDNIAHRYDFLNHFLSMGIDKRWRNRLVRMLAEGKPQNVLDVATGTGDLALTAASSIEGHITGIDISENMLEMGKQKVNAKGLDEKISMLVADSQDLPFDDATFEAVMVAFGVRNFEDLKQGLNEFARVLKPAGKTFILEFSTPRKFPVKQIYRFYFKNILPSLGKWISRDKEAYTYLPDSVDAFPSGKDFLQILSYCGFRNVEQYRLSFGIATIYVGEK